MSPKETYSSPEKLFNDISQFVSESRALLEQGAMMELAGLDERVKTLCDAVLQLSQSDRLVYAEQLQQLLAELKSLGEAMTTQRDAMADAIKDISSHRKASVAYRTAASKQPKKKDEN
jgi:hypothetical protein